MKDHHIELLQREIDGLNSDEDSAQLHALLETDAELKTAFDELRAVQTAFSAYVEKEPSPELKRAIMRALPAPVSAKSADIAWWAGIIEQFRAPRPVTLAYAFSVGLVIAFAVSTVLMPITGFDASDSVVGTMGSVDRDGLQNESVYPFSAEGVTGQVRVGEWEDIYVVELIWTAETEIAATITFDDPSVSVVRTENVDREPRLRESIVPGIFELAASGPVHEIVSFSLPQSEDGVFEIIVRSEGGQLFELSTAPLVVSPN